VLIDELLGWRRETPYAQDSDYVFASTKMRGKQPYRMSRIMDASTYLELLKSARTDPARSMESVAVS